MSQSRVSPRYTVKAFSNPKGRLLRNQNDLSLISLIEMQVAQKPRLGLPPVTKSSVEWKQ